MTAVLQLVWSFFKIGLFSYGGGYAMVPMMQGEIAAHGWLPVREFADIVAISQMTPGPIAVNAATYIGYRVAGVFGSAAATLGVTLPSFILVVLVTHFLQKFKESRAVNSLLSGIRPATVGLIGAAVVFFARMSFFIPYPEWKGFGILPGEVLRLGFADLRIPTLVIFLIILIETKLFKLKPIPAIVLSAALGMIML
ncbi:MAG: chromate transporter [Spirochaetia bacterium]|jgi:chromate transporter|nr:chromate transporter [Spirochaetia bacterium]